MAKTLEQRVEDLEEKQRRIAVLDLAKGHVARGTKLNREQFVNLRLWIEDLKPAGVPG